MPNSRWLKQLRRHVETIPLLRELKYRIVRPVHAVWYAFFATQEDREISLRDQVTVTACPDNRLIPRVPAAGRIKRGCLIMHNGVKVLPSCYYGHGNLRMLKKTRGVHEPQEERVFQEVLKWMPKRAVMIELGAYWSFYSAWFHQVVGEPHCYMVEPLLSNLNYGRKNFKLNGFQGHFTQAFIGDRPGDVNGIPQVAVDSFLEDRNIAHVDILHADIQGYELSMLHGASRSIERRAIDYLFVSTHSAKLHEECESFLRKRGYLIVASANLDDAYGPDGVIVARREELSGLEPVEIALRSKENQSNTSCSRTRREIAA